MAIKTIKQAGGGDYTTFADWLASPPAPGDEAEVYTGDYAETLDITIPGLYIRVAAGQTVRLNPAAGTYVIRLSAGSTGFKIKGESKANPIVLHYPGASSNQNVLINDDVACEFENVKFRGAPAGNRGYIYAGVASTAAVRVTGCTDYTAGVVTNFVRGASFADLQIRETDSRVGGVLLNTNAWAGVIDRFTSTGTCVVAPIAATWSTLGACVVSNGIHLGIGAGVTSLPLYATAHSIKVQNCLFFAGDADAYNSGVGIGITGAVAGIEVTNCRVQGYDVNITADNAFSPTYTSTFGHRTSAYGGSATAGTGCISTDPLEIGGGDHHLTATSPCRDAGTNTGLPDDLDGVTRPKGAAYDIGPYEFTDPPEVVSIVVVDETSAEVTFDKPMLDNADLADPANYPLTATDGGAVVTVSSAVPGAGTYPTTVTLTHTEGTSGKTYRVDVSNVVERYGEVVDPAHASASFVATAVAPQVTGAARVSAQSARVTFSEAMDVAVPSMTDPASWAIASVDGDPVAITGVTLPGGVCTLAFDAIPTSGALYTITAPADLTDVAGNVINGAFRTASFVVPWVVGGFRVAAGGGSGCAVRMVEVMEPRPERVEV